MLLEPNKVVPSCVSLCARERERPIGIQRATQVALWHALCLNLDLFSCFFKKNLSNAGFCRPLSVSFLFRTSGKITVKLARLRFWDSKLVDQLDGLCNDHVLSTERQNSETFDWIVWEAKGGSFIVFLFRQQLPLCSCVVLRLIEFYWTK